MLLFTRKANNLFLFLLLLLSLTFLPSCAKKDIQFGTELGETYTRIMEVDTVSVEMSTYLLDSFPTSGISNFFLGAYSDPLLGKVSATPYFQLAVPTDLNLETDAVYDSLSFHIKLNRYAYGDTLATQAIQVYELAEPLDYTYSGYIFNTSSFARKSPALGSTIVRIRPATTDSVRIRLSDAKGLELFNKLRQGAYEISSTTAFLDYFRGIVLESSTTAGAIYGFNHTADSIYMRLHYHTSSLYPESKHKDFAFHNGKFSNQLAADRTGTQLAGTGARIVPSLQSGNQSFVQSGTGVVLKMTFPSLRNILQIDPTIRLMKARLELRAGSNTGNFGLPAALFLVQTDATNAFGAAVLDSTGEEIAYSAPVIDALYNNRPYYSFTITSYIQALLNSSGTEDNGFFLVEGNPGSSGFLSRVPINNSLLPEKSKLILSLLSLKN
ncbi:MAG TPA: DUF4270 family protein [Flavisolibacter sp.]|nr:DUF4270 family protein [Flavisolibacter sp.]